jgi:serine/threonine-protein kinase
MSGDPLDRVRDFFGADEPSERPRHGKYEILRELGRGGMAVVYEALDPDLRRSVALKVLERGDRERLRREAAAAARLRHPNIVGVHEVGDDFIAMERVEGKPLSEAMPSLALRDRVAALEAVARAVAHAHAQGVVHRDLKPGNILREPGGRAVVTDFGLARIEGEADLTRTGAVVGTPHYMSPEQVRGGRAGPAADVWALGVMLYEAVAGKRPFEGETALAIYDAIVRSEPASLAGDLGAVALRALEKEASRRTPSAAAFADDLGRWLRGEPVGARPASVVEKAARRIRKHPMAAALVGVALVALVFAASERERGISTLRKRARTALEAALDLRRAGSNAGMLKYLRELEAACLEAPAAAEADYLLGRMHRALLDEGRALDFQERALSKEAAYAPALYERAVLLSMRHAREAKETLDALQGDSTGDPMEQPDLGLAELGERIVRDARAFLAAGGSGVEAVVAKGLVAAHTKRFAEARGFLDEALRQDPLLEEARGALAAVVWAELAPGVEDRERVWKRAEEVYTQGLARDQGYVPHYLERGQLRWSRGSARRHRGLDPMPDYLAAEADFARAIDLDPKSPAAWAWRGQVRVYHAIFAIERGGDPRPALERSAEDCTKAIGLDAEHSRGWVWRGNGRFYRGVWMAERGEDAVAVFQAGEQDQGEAIRTAAIPDHEHRWRGRLRAQLGAALARAGKDPTAAFAAAEGDFRASAAIKAPDSWAWLWKSTIALERALWRRARGEDPAADFELAEQELERSLALNRLFGEAWRQRGTARWHRAEWLEKAGDRARARDAYAGAAADFRQALTINANFRGQVGDRPERAQRKTVELGE